MNYNRGIAPCIAIGSLAFVATYINVISYFIAREELSHGYTPKQIEERFNQNENDPFAAVDRVLSFVGKPSRELAYRKYHETEKPRRILVL